MILPPDFDAYGSDCLVRVEYVFIPFIIVGVYSAEQWSLESIFEHEDDGLAHLFVTLDCNVLKSAGIRLGLLIIRGIECSSELNFFLEIYEIQLVWELLWLFHGAEQERKSSDYFFARILSAFEADNLLTFRDFVSIPVATGRRLAPHSFEEDVTSLIDKSDSSEIVAISSLHLDESDGLVLCDINRVFFPVSVIKIGGIVR